jgi:hypothetical protein
MIDPNFELERLRSTLKTKGLSDSQIERLYANASSEISMAITDAVASAMRQAVEIGEEARAHQFLKEIKATRFGNGFEITTDTGQTYFKEPPFPMMSALLKSPKVAKDGSLYKHIPMAEKNDSRPTSSMDAAVMINQAQKDAKNNWSSSKDVTAGAAQFSGAFAAAKANNRNSGVRQANSQKNAKGAVKFKTVSSKQDPSSQWVRPAKETDMTGPLMNINSELRKQIESDIMSIIQSYEELY